MYLVGEDAKHIDSAFDEFKNYILRAIVESHRNIKNSVSLIEMEKELKNLETKFATQKSDYMQKIDRLNIIKKISVLNSKVIVSDIELTDLRVGGRDSFSQLKIKELYEALGKKCNTIEDAEIIFTRVFDAFKGNQKYICVALRWVLRGLSLPHAVKKVKLDAAKLDGIIFANPK